MNVVGYFLMTVGSIFFFLGGLGIFRMPDVFNRLQAGTKATTLGAMAFIVGVGLVQPDWFFKTLVIAVLIAITNPIGSSVLARTAFRTTKPEEGTRFIPQGDDAE